MPDGCAWCEDNRVNIVSPGEATTEHPLAANASKVYFEQMSGRSEIPSACVCPCIQEHKILKNGN